MDRYAPLLAVLRIVPRLGFALITLTLFLFLMPASATLRNTDTTRPIIIAPGQATLTTLSDDLFDQNQLEYQIELAAGTEDDPMARERWFWHQRAFPANVIPAERHQQAIDTEMQNLFRPEAGAAQWQELGPMPLNEITYGGDSSQDASGRMLSVIIHPNDQNTILVGTAQGGIWKSTDGGQSFRAVADDLPSLAIKVMRYAPSNPSIVYAGTGEPHSSTSIYGRGVYKSTDGGDTWTVLPASGNGWDFDYASVSGLQVHPSDPNTVFVTTAAIRTIVDHFNPAQAPTTGIFKTTDGGTTWTMLQQANNYDYFSSLNSNVGFMDLELALNNPNLLYATEYAGPIWKSTDGGTTWNAITPTAGNTAKFPASVPSYRYYDSGSGTFTGPLTRLGVTVSDYSRIELGLSQSNPDVVYAGVAVEALFLDTDGDPNTAEVSPQVGLLFKTTDGGNTWTWLGDWGGDGVPNYCSTQCAYDNIVEVNPTNPNDVIIGGSANYNYAWFDSPTNPTRYQLSPWKGMVHRTLDGGNTWIDTNPHCTNWVDTGQVSNNLPVFQCGATEAQRVIHPDVHALAYDPHNANRIYAGTDGGLHRGNVSNTGGNPFDYLWENINNNLATLQFYFFGAHPTDANKIIGGLQDNSVAYWDGSTWEGWGFGDGTWGAFDPQNPNIVYMGTQLNIHRHDSGGAKVALGPDGQAANGWNLSIFNQNHYRQGESMRFLPVAAIDPVETNKLYAATDAGIYLSTDRGNTWGDRLNSDQALANTPSSISVSPVDNQLVWVGTEGSEIYLFDFGVGSYNELSSGLPLRYVTQVHASYADANTVYATFSGYDVNSFTNGKVFKSTNKGQSWSSITGNLPDVPVSAIAINRNNEQNMWVGSDIGVFETTDGGQTWASFRKNMPVVAIMDLEHNANTCYLMASTHGRGMWRITTGASATQNFTTGAPGSTFNISGVGFPANQTVTASIGGTSIGTFNSGSGNFSLNLAFPATIADGLYTVSLSSSGNCGSSSFGLTIDSQAPQRSAGAADTTLNVPDSAAGLTTALYLPVLFKEFNRNTLSPTATPTSSNPGPTNTPLPTATNTPVPGATDTPTPVATDTPTATATPTTNPGGGLPSVTNGDFESGSGVGWTESSTNFNTLIYSSSDVTFPPGFAPRSGNYVAWTGGGDNEVSQLSQTFAIPNTTDTIVFEVYYQTRSSDLCGFDTTDVLIDDTVIGSIDPCNNITTWTRLTLNFTDSPYLGQTVTIKFRTTTDSSGLSSFLMDDAAFTDVPPANRPGEITFSVK